MIFYQLFEAESSTYTYILADEKSREGLIIDPVLETVSRDLQLLEELNIRLIYILETHLHADHVTGAAELRRRTGAKALISAASGVTCADRLLNDGDEIQFGSYRLKALATPGHTNSCMSYSIDGKIFTGDVLLIRGTGRTDFQEGDSRKLYQSVHQKIFTLPPLTEVFPGHDYKGHYKSTVEQEIQFNPRLGAGKSEEQFVQIMSELKLAYPKKIDLALPANKNLGETHV
jgi:sulfur dioxygenase